HLLALAVADRNRQPGLQRHALRGLAGHLQGSIPLGAAHVDIPRRHRRPIVCAGELLTKLMTTEGFRWPAFFQRCAEPLFLLNSRRRLVFANMAWQQLTGRNFSECRGMGCRRAAYADDELTTALGPPPEVLRGLAGRARRRIPTGAGTASWCDIDYFPLSEGGETL